MEPALELAVEIGRLMPSLERGGVADRHAAHQLFRAASAIGANLEEAEAAASRREMAYKQSIALREAREAEYWLRLLSANRPPDSGIDAMRNSCGRLVAILTKSIRTLRTPAQRS